MNSRRIVWLCLVALPVIAAADMPPSEASAPARIFWAGVNSLKFLFTAVSTLSGGAEPGQVWIMELGTGQQIRVGAADGLTWPVLAPDGQTVYALRGHQLVRFGLSGGTETTIVAQADWRKLVGVVDDGTVLAFVAGVPRAHPAMIMPNGELTVLPQPQLGEERRSVSHLLQQNQTYSSGVTLLVRPSAHGGAGSDVFLQTGGTEQNISNCGDDLCGQPSLSPDGLRVAYVRTHRAR